MVIPIPDAADPGTPDDLISPDQFGGLIWELYQVYTRVHANSAHTPISVSDMSAEAMDLIYPFDQLRYAIHIGDAKARDKIITEGFAQAHGWFWSNPDAMKESAPLFYKFFKEEVYNAEYDPAEPYTVTAKRLRDALQKSPVSDGKREAGTTRDGTADTQSAGGRQAGPIPARGEPTGVGDDDEPAMPKSRFKPAVLPAIDHTEQQQEASDTLVRDWQTAAAALNDARQYAAQKPGGMADAMLRAAQEQFDAAMTALGGEREFQKSPQLSGERPVTGSGDPAGWAAYKLSEAQRKYQKADAELTEAEKYATRHGSPDLLGRLRGWRALQTRAQNALSAANEELESARTYKPEGAADDEAIVARIQKAERRLAFVNKRLDAATQAVDRRSNPLAQRRVDTARAAFAEATRALGAAKTQMATRTASRNRAELPPAPGSVAAIYPPPYESLSKGLKDEMARLRGMEPGAALDDVLGTLTRVAETTSGYGPAQLFRDFMRLANEPGSTAHQQLALGNLYLNHPTMAAQLMALTAFVSDRVLPVHEHFAKLAELYEEHTCN